MSIIIVGNRTIETNSILAGDIDFRSSSGNRILVGDK